MSRVKLASLTIASTVCFQPMLKAEDSVFQQPVLSTAEIHFEPVSSRAALGFVEEVAPPEEPTQDSLQTKNDAGKASGDSPKPSPSDRKISPLRSTKDQKDATEVAKPKVVEPPIALGELTIPNLSLENIGTGNTPDDVTADRLPDSIPLPLANERGLFVTSTKSWVPGGFCHQPLYFEDAMLERHGHQRFPYLQPFVSAARFYGSIPLAPYKWTLQRPLEDRHTLGSFRPGSPAPIVRQRLPYDETAIRNQIGASAAAAVAIP